MAPKKQQLSPFGLFMTKMKRDNHWMRQWSFPRMVSHCKDIYEQLSPPVRQRLQDLSSSAKNKTISESELNSKLDALDINDKENNGQEDWDDCSSIKTESVCNGSIVSGYESAKEQPLKTQIMVSKEDEINDIVGEVLESLTEDFQKQSIIVICFNIAVKTMDEIYIPVEIALTEFTLKEGIIEEYTELIANGVPEGYYGVAKQFSQKFHKLPFGDQNKDFSDDYELLFNNIYGFMSSTKLKDKRNRRLVFCKAESVSGLSDRDQVEGCLQWFDQKVQSNRSLTKDFVVAELSDLMLQMTQKYYETPQTKKWCVDALNETTYEYEPDMRCSKHSEDDNSFCGRYATKRSVLLFIGSLKAMQIKVKPLAEKSSQKKAIGIGRGRLINNILNLRLNQKIEM